MRWHRLVAISLFGTVTCLAAFEPVAAQTQTGSINGVVSDPNGEALPGATVSVSGPSVMGTKTDVTNASGAFRFPTLLPGGDYRVEFALGGFTTVIREGIIVRVGQTTTLHIRMELSAVADEIVVTGETPMVDVTSPTASTSFTPPLLENIPNSRTFEATVSQSPGVVDSGSGGAGGGNSWSAKGGAAVSNEIAFDGVAISNPVYHISSHDLVYEVVEEVQVVTGGLPAELGNVGSAFVNVVTKSGGNEFHGEASVYYQDDSLQSDNLTDELRQEGITAANELLDFEDWSLSLGGPILRDKLWFAAGFRRYDDAFAVNGFPYPDSTDRDYIFGKVTWQPNERHNLFVMFNRNDITTYYAPASQFYAPEATRYQPIWNEMGKVKWTGVLTDNVFVEGDLGTANNYLDLQAQEGASHAYYDYATTRWTGGPTLLQYNVLYRKEAKAALAWFKDEWGGSHSFKFGIQWERGDWDAKTYKPFSPMYAHYLFAGRPLFVIFSNLPVNPVMQRDGLHGFAQDSWRVSDRVTLSLGVRVNSWEGNYPAQGTDAFTYGPNVYFPPVDIDNTTLIDWTVFEPRLGATIALDDEGKSALRLGLNRYHHGLLIGYMIYANPNAVSSSLHPWVDLDGDLFADPNEVGRATAVGGGSFSTIDPNIKNPYTDEVIIGFERELFRDFSVKLNATWRKDKEWIDTTNPAETEESFVPTTITDPGPDGVLGTPDDRPLTVYNQIADFASQQVTTNLDLGERTYKGVELIATRRLSGRWQALGSIVWQRSTGTVDTDFNSSKGWSNAFDDPNKLINREGPLSLDREWQAKLMGTYLAPLGFSFSGYWTYQTGVPLYRTLTVALNQGAVTVVVDPRDSHRNDDLSRLDLRAEKRFAFGSRPVELGLMLDVFNALNENGVTDRRRNTEDGFGRPLAIQAPRIVRLGGRVRF